MITLEPKDPAIVIEGQSLSFTCRQFISGISFLQFKYLDENNMEQVIGDVLLQSDKCNTYVQNVSLNCNFTSNTFVLTLKKPVHNQTIICEFVFNRTYIRANSTIFVQGISIFCFNVFLAILSRMLK